MGKKYSLWGILFLAVLLNACTGKEESQRSAPPTTMITLPGFLVGQQHIPLNLKSVIQLKDETYQLD